MTKITLRDKITPLLTEFKNANGRGSLMLAATHMVNMIETLVKHIENCENPAVYCANPYPDFETTDYYKSLKKLKENAAPSVENIADALNSSTKEIEEMVDIIKEEHTALNESFPLDSLQEELDVEVTETPQMSQDIVIEENVSELPKEEETSVEASVAVLDNNESVEEVQEDTSKKRGRKPTK